MMARHASAAGQVPAAARAGGHARRRAQDLAGEEGQSRGAGSSCMPKPLFAPQRAPSPHLFSRAVAPWILAFRFHHTTSRLSSTHLLSYPHISIQQSHPKRTAAPAGAMTTSAVLRTCRQRLEGLRLLLRDFARVVNGQYHCYWCVCVDARGSDRTARERRKGWTDVAEQAPAQRDQVLGGGGARGP
jgi:hypothetical protein